ncbi:flagellar basal body rod modification protein FlgD [Gottschalkia acidurici 9a]|uniref:Flagellar basal body rod modification protein FlgD n=1 Tax=Gottschalkia acidurici (strain ATCC 7906 / DSM 604 / BCRC 14475 / CIP 104303 / KCTC 5404 / NCIMB 10678 / 9a) TaxID=1128398 RepID=K0B0Z8_GOTA9|nr:flagellar hook capping FlgD N-terminal domain-containing protein [Gottschalkia acidurici]AFS78605.1 flagellar basal body rod modification protein FlgD [Gottschalkia acidurici 9a]
MPVNNVSNDYKPLDYNIADQEKKAQEKDNASRVPNDYLGKDAFLQLMIAQLRYQNPLEPMDNKDSIAQMAQFSALEQMQNLNTNMQMLGLGIEYTMYELSEQLASSQKEVIEGLSAIKKAIEAYGGSPSQDKGEEDTTIPDKSEEDITVPDKSDDKTETA